MTNRPENGFQLKGSMTALVTPFTGGELDWPCWDRLIDRQINAGTDWLVPLGTTGESPTLTENERERLAVAAIERARGRRPVAVGTGTNNTAETVTRTKQAAAWGADAALVVTPCYNRPTAEGLFRHYAAVAEAVDLPIIIYNVPARTGVNITNDVIVRLKEQFPNIKAVKDATGTVEYVTELRARCDIDILCGDDALSWPFMALGAVGIISVIANLVPALMKSLVNAARENEVETARQHHRRVFDIATGIARFGPNPLPIKTAMTIAGLLNEEFRLPLCPLDSAAREGIEQIMRRHEIAAPGKP